MMNSFRVAGGKVLSGSIEPQGAKNEALQILSACLLTDRLVTITNIPNIVDVHVLIEMMKKMGVDVRQMDKSGYTFQANKLNTEYIFSEAFILDSRKLRGSVMLSSVLLVRLKKSILPMPGGDKIGRRSLDTHLRGFQKLGINLEYRAITKSYTLEAKEIVGSYILLDEPSVTGTANLIMASVLAKGQTTLYNAACEPYIYQLCKMLQSMGAKISGIGSNMIKIEGVDSLTGTVHTLLPDMIEVGSFIGLAAVTQSRITIKNCGVEHLGMIPDKFKSLGIKLRIQGDDIIVPNQEKYTIENDSDGSIPTFYDNPWPGFTPDLLSIVLVVAIHAVGSVLIHQKMFESRLFFVDKLIDMGAKIILCDPHRATVIGLGREQKLRSITMSSPDIRAGVSLLLAALSAEGTSIIQNVHQIDRGYQNIDERLRAIGADIERING